MQNSEKIVDVVIAELKATESRAPQSWAALRKRLVRVVDEQLAPKPANGVNPARLYTTHEVARLLQVDASTIAKWIDSGKLVAFRTPGKHRRVRESDLHAFCDRYQIPVTGQLSS